MRDSNPELAKAGLAILKEFAREIGEFQRPPETGAASLTEKVLPFSIVRGTRGYLETIAHQLNGSYENGWYDACSVMMRKLIEALILEVFEERGMVAKIQTPSGDFLQLEALIGKVICESTWNLSRMTKRALSDVKGLGDVITQHTVGDSRPIVATSTISRSDSARRSRSLSTWLGWDSTMITSSQSCARPTHRVLDRRSHAFQIPPHIRLPKPQHCPPVLLEPRRHLVVAFHALGELVDPVIAVGSLDPGVQRLQPTLP